MNAPVDLYGTIAPFYEFCTNPFLDPIRREVRRLILDRPHGSLLDVGCGTGRQLAFLSGSGLRLAGVDASPAMIREAKQRIPDSVPCLLGDGTALPFPGSSFDCVLLSMILHEMDPSVRNTVLKECRRVLSSHGMLVIVEYLTPVRWQSRLGSFLARGVERLAGGRHYENYLQFLSTGATEHMLQKNRFAFALQKLYFLKTIGLVTANPDPYSTAVSLESR